MGSKKINPVTPGMRGLVTGDFSEVTKTKPEKRLTSKLNSSGGRNNKGRITSRHRGGGHKKKYRIKNSEAAHNVKVMEAIVKSSKKNKKIYI